MTGSTFWRIVWKEYRTQRGFWLAVLGMAFVGQLLVLANVWKEPAWVMAAFTIALYAPAIYSLGCGAMLFAGEREDGTYELLRSLPVSAVRLLTGKLSFGIVSAAVMLGLLLLVASLVAALLPSRQSFYPEPHQIRFLLLLSLHMLAWGTFFSLMTGRVLHSVMLATIGVWPVLYVSVSLVPLAVLSVVLIADFWLARRWLSGRNVSWLRIRIPSRATASAAKFDVVKETSPPWWRAFTRLLWQEWRHARGFVAVYCGVAICLLIFSTVTAQTLSFDFAFLIIPSAPLLMGVWSFRGEQVGRKFRFPAERGVAPQGVWLSKQLIWFALAVIVTLLFLLVDYLAESFWVQTVRYTATGSAQHVFWERAYPMLWGLLGGDLCEVLIPQNPLRDRSLTALVLLFIGLGYAAGQFVSLLIPRAVTATFVGALLAAGLWGWLYLMDRLQVPLLWSVAPLVLILLGATLARAPDWMLERPGWRPWLRVGAICLLPTALLVTAVACYRVFEIPTQSLGFLQQNYLRPGTPEESRTADMYRQAALELSALRSGGEQDNRIYAVDGWEYATPGERKWLEENQDVLQRTLAATQREHCLLVDPSKPGACDRPESWRYRSGELRLLLLFSARKLEAEDRLDEALGRYLAVVRFGKHVAARRGLDGWKSGNAMIEGALGWLWHWAAHPKQTPARLRAAIRKIEHETSSLPLLSEALKTERVVLGRQFTEDWDDLIGYEANQRPHTVTVLNVVRRWLPWEKARTLRLLDVLIAHRLHQVKELEESLVRPGADLTAWKESYDGEQNVMPWSLRWKTQPWKWLRTTPLMGEWAEVPLSWLWNPIPLVDLETRRRGWLLSLALSAWRKEHGELPNRLDVLVGPYFGELPLDPWSGHHFNYRSEGFPVPVNSPDFRYRRSGEGMEPGQPLLWSVGSHNQQIVVGTGSHSGQREYRVVNSGGVSSPRDDGTGVYDRTLWLDRAFPIP